MKTYGLNFTPARVSILHDLVKTGRFVSLSSLSRELCKRFNWRSASGRLKETACRKALSALELRGDVILPKGRMVSRRKSSSSFSSFCLPDAVPVSCSLRELGSVSLELIHSRFRKSSRIWGSLMDAYHYLGNAVLPGAQLRYLVHSSKYGYVGALSFNSGSWQLKDRDKYIGWSDCAREAHIQQVVSNSRFLVLPHIRVPNLASHILGLCARRIASDWEERYGTRPLLLETFVDPARFTGCCYRAANWVRVGVTSGRRASDSQQNGSPKDLYLYPLEKGWRKGLCEEPEVLLRPKEREGLHTDWVGEEFAGANFHDPRLGRRLVELARDFFRQPLSPIPQSCGTLAKIKGAYRFFTNKKVTMKRILHPHIESTAARIKEQKVALCVQDTTTLNYTFLQESDGFGPIGTAADSSMGLIMHDTMAFAPDGTPLGLLDVQVWARDGKNPRKSRLRKELPIEEKESNKWLESFRAVAKVRELCPDTTLISVGDRESDMYDLFYEASRAPSGVELLVRCERSRNRKAENVKLWNKMEREAVAGGQIVELPKRGNRPARRAHLEIRHAKVSLTPPRDSKLPPLEAWIVYARETKESAGNQTPLEWMLHSSFPVNDLEDASKCLEWYARRWGIEVFHRTLKSGCKIEDRQFGNAHTLETCLAVDLVVAWRIYHLTMLGRETPDLPCTVFFEEIEWKALYLFKNKTTTLPETSPSLWEATLMVASLGGFMGRKNDGRPGTTVMWRGIQRLDDIAETYGILLPALRAGP